MRSETSFRAAAKARSKRVLLLNRQPAYHLPSLRHKISLVIVEMLDHNSLPFEQRNRITRIRRLTYEYRPCFAPI